MHIADAPTKYRCIFQVACFSKHATSTSSKETYGPAMMKILNWPTVGYAKSCSP
jgi:hypothetical protein